MRAVVYSEYGGTPVLTRAAEPGCPADGVVIEVGATGVCRSDWRVDRRPRGPGDRAGVAG